MMEIDAKNQKLGRLASKIALILQGKHKPSFSPEKAGDEEVIVKNVDKIKIEKKKLETKVYYRHSGYPGELKKITLKELFEKNPQEVLKKAVWGMLPKNKLRKIRIKRLKFK
jgi:large subunit ribosomal protein L13